MRIEIDQSGKIENTNRPTVVACSNKNNDIIVVLSKDKKIIQRYFRQIDKPKLFIYLTFVTLVFFLIKNRIKNRDQIVIDREYPGYEKLISQKLKQLIQEKTKIDDISISISQIGKKSKAHDLAWHQLRSKSHKNVKKISSEKIIKTIKENLKSGSI